MELEEAFKILEGDPKLQCKYGNDGDGCINPQIAKDEAILTIQNYIDFQTIPVKKVSDKIKWLDEMLNNPDKEVIYTNYRYTRNILEELLGDKIDEDIKYRPFTK